MAERWRKKPIEIEAVQFVAGRVKPVRDFLGPHFHPIKDGNHVAWLYIETLEGKMRVDPGDWIIKGIAGEFYPCRSGIFEATYEKAEN